MPQISVSGPADLRTVLPFHLGFQPTRSVVVVCCATLEHDKRFWLSVKEMQRVLRPGGLLVIGVPFYSRGWTGVASSTTSSSSWVTFNCRPPSEMIAYMAPVPY